MIDRTTVVESIRHFVACADADDDTLIRRLEENGFGDTDARVEADLA